MTPGTRAKVEVIRRGERRTVEVVVAGAGDAETLRKLLTGVALAPATDELRSRFSVPADLSGLVVTEVSPSSPFSRFLRTGAVLVGVNDRPIPSLEALRKALVKGVNKFYVHDRGRPGYFAVRVP